MLARFPASPSARIVGVKLLASLPCLCPTAVLVAVTLTALTSTNTFESAPFGTAIWVVADSKLETGVVSDRDLLPPISIGLNDAVDGVFGTGAGVT